MSNWATGAASQPACVCHFRGFPPGTDIALLQQTLADALGDLAALIALAGNRRELRGGKGSKNETEAAISGAKGRGRNGSGGPKGRGRDETGEGSAKGRGGKSKGGSCKNGSRGGKGKGSQCDEGEVPIPSGEELGADLLSGDASTTIEAIETIFQNDSFQAVLDGGDTTTFDANMEQIGTAVTTLVSSKPATLDAAQSTQWDTAANLATAAYELLLNSKEQVLTP